jgi:RNA-directed DNA polymerase
MRREVPVRFGEGLGVRFPRATRLVCCFQDEDDAKRFMSTMTERLAQFGLEVEPSKTKLIRFGSHAQRDCGKDGRRRPATFSFLGLTHYVGTSRTGRFVVGRKTEGKRMGKKLKELGLKLQRLRQEGGKAMLTYVRQHLQGHFNYYGVSGNSRSINVYGYHAAKVLLKWLNRRSQRPSVTWELFYQLLREGLLPKPRIIHNLYPKPLWMT